MPCEDSSGPDPDLDCLKLFVPSRVGAKVHRLHYTKEGSRAPCCFRGCGSLRIALKRTAGVDWRAKDLERLHWDCGLCFLFQIFVAIPVILLMLVYGWFYTFDAPQFNNLEASLDKKWGFVLEEGNDYTAPVWMGEFGSGQRGNYWLNFVKYLGARDVDWAYWPLNPDKQTDGYFDDWGNWNSQELHWDEDSYSLLDEDYLTVRDPWRLLDLTAIMSSPATEVLNSIPCRRSRLGAACGG